MNEKNKKEAPASQQGQGGASVWAGKIRPFLKKNAKWLIPAACVLAALVLFWALKRSPEQQVTADPEYVQDAPQVQDVSNSLSGVGTLKPAQTYTVTSLVDGKILAADFEEGDVVEEGTVLYTVDSADAATNVEKAQIALEQAQRNYEKVVDRQYVRAEASGTVSVLKVKKGDEITSGQEVAIIRDSSTMLLSLLFPAVDAANFWVGQDALVTLDGTFEQIPGRVLSVTGTDALGTGNMLTRTVVVAVPNAGGLTTAQAATASVAGIHSIASAAFTYNDEKTLTASAAGTVTGLLVKEGDAVDKDAILIELSGDDLTESIQSASETLRNAELSMKNMEDTMANYTITSPIKGTIVQKNYKQGDSLSTGKEMCIIYDLSYLEMVISVDELNISALEVGQPVVITADAVNGQSYEGKVTRVSVAGNTSGGTTTYPVTIRIDQTEGLRPGMNANAEIVTAKSSQTLTVPNAAIIRGNYVLVTTDSPSAANADESMTAPEGYVYVPVKTGVSGDDYTEILSGLCAEDTIAYDPTTVTTDYYDYYGGVMIMGG
ncbi:MAG: HlyD family efflux transporter periplasmic adaptor subunit [Faecalibacterium prausnitzii]|nr:HlyD family efflux transporter periplasmic adaptor subunit [Faecalibacterium prausnitzii]